MLPLELDMPPPCDIEKQSCWDVDIGLRTENLLDTCIERQTGHNAATASARHGSVLRHRDFAHSRSHQAQNILLVGKL